MAPRTLTSTWKQFERLARRYNKADLPRTNETKALDELCVKTNSSRIVDALATMFVHTYQGMEEVAVEFATSGGEDFPDWVTSYSEEENRILVNPVGVIRFEAECETSVETLKTPVARESFQNYRYQAYLSQLRKLPAQHLLFLQLLKEVANARQVTRAERKGGGVEEVEDECYMSLLWAFKELETFFYQSGGVTLRTEYTIRWYESDWIVGKK